LNIFHRDAGSHFGERCIPVTKWFQEILLLFELLLLVLIVQWLLSFFGQTTLPGFLHTGGFIYLLSIVIFSLIAIKFLSWL
jgi:hypothetical protein